MAFTQHMQILLGDVVWRPIQPSLWSHRGSASFCITLGEVPWWALFLIRNMCNPMVFVHVKNPLISWVQTKGHSPLMMPACAGVPVWTWWKLIVLSWLVSWIQGVCQSPKHTGPWETSRDLSSLSSLQPLIFCFLFSCFSISPQTFTGTYRDHSWKFTEGDLYSI